MKNLKIFILLVTALLPLSFFPSCFFPEKFDVSISLDKDGTYSFSYDGILTFIPAKMEEVKQGNLSKKEETEIRELEKTFRTDPKFKKVEYLGHAQFQVLYQDQGKLTSPMYFLSSEIKYFSLKPFKNNQVEFKGLSVAKEQISELNKLKLNIDGRIKIKTTGKIIQHNATGTPYFFGLLGDYSWRIKSLEDPTPTMLIQLE